MANSDNVVRGGLTSKHVDVPELLRVLNFEPMAPEPVSTRWANPCEMRYLTPAAEFTLSVLRLNPGEVLHSADRRGVEVLLCVAGSAQLAEAGAAGRSLGMARGASVLVPASAPAYRLSGPAVLYKAGVPGDDR
jgi:mannose-6-phosphate isomerase